MLCRKLDRGSKVGDTPTLQRVHSPPAFCNTLSGSVFLTKFENMIEIIKEQVKMPSISTERRFQKICVNNKWEVIDTHNENKTRYKGAYEDVMIACHNLNKKFYRDGVI